MTNTTAQKDSLYGSPLTARQAEILDKIRALIELRGFAPTLDEIAFNCGFTKSAARDVVSVLERKGRILTADKKSRSIRLVTNNAAVVPSRKRFVDWVCVYGHRKLARDLNEGLDNENLRKVIHSWTNRSSKRNIPPSPSYATRIVKLSEKHPLPDGPLTLDDLLDGTTGLRGQQRTVTPSPIPNPPINGGAHAPVSL